MGGRLYYRRADAATTRTGEVWRDRILPHPVCVCLTIWTHRNVIQIIQSQTNTPITLNVCLLFLYYCKSRRKCKILLSSPTFNRFFAYMSGHVLAKSPPRTRGKDAEERDLLCGSGGCGAIDTVIRHTHPRHTYHQPTPRKQIVYLLFLRIKKNPERCHWSADAGKDSGVTAAVAILLLLSSFPMRAAPLHNWWLSANC